MPCAGCLIFLFAKNDAHYGSYIIAYKTVVNCGDYVFFNIFKGPILIFRRKMGGSEKIPARRRKGQEQRP
jgi:hypothetical protein